jgi:hypothetical protein
MDGYLVTLYGEHLGKPVYFLVCGKAAFPLSISDAIRACENKVDYLPAALLDDNQRTLCWDAWKNADLVLGEINA